MKLWQKNNTHISEIIEKFTVGKDREFDLLLAKYDVIGTIAHIRMLEKVGLMSNEESEKAIKSLGQIQSEIVQKKFRIEDNVEDIHSQVELSLIKNIGDAGKKIHSGRSRNDQVAVDIKLYIRAEILEVKDETKNLFDLLIEQSERFKEVLLPGYTHLQIAMPSSFGLWFGGYAESLVDDLEVLLSAYRVANKNPLGSGAGYGSSFPLDRKLTTELLGFATLNFNSVYAQMSRGKTEKVMAMGLSVIAGTLNKLAMDCCLYMSQNFGFISFPSELTTGSSIMPHKKNPDVFELIRARCNRIQSMPNELTLLLTNLPSGYHRDLQLTKEILFPAIEELKSCLGMMHLMLSNIQLKEDILKDDKYKYIFSVEAVNDLVNKGIPFREAYLQVGNLIENEKFKYDQDQGIHHTHTGSITNLNNSDIMKEMETVLNRFES